VVSARAQCPDSAGRVAATSFLRLLIPLNNFEFEPPNRRYFRTPCTSTRRQDSRVAWTASEATTNRLSAGKDPARLLANSAAKTRVNTLTAQLASFDFVSKLICICGSTNRRSYKHARLRRLRLLVRTQNACRETVSVWLNSDDLRWPSDLL